MSKTSAYIFFVFLTTCFAFDVIDLIKSEDSYVNWMKADTDKDGKSWSVQPSNKAFVSQSTGTSVQQSNWLISPFISLQAAENISVMIEMTFLMCNYSNRLVNTSNCKVNLDLFMMTSDNKVDDIENQLKSFKYVAEIIPNEYDKIAPFVIDDIQVPNKAKGIYISLVDNGTHVVIPHIHIMAKVCANQTANLVVFDNSVPSTNAYTGICVKNSEAVKEPLSRICQSNATWADFDGSCECKKEYVLTADTCIEKACTLTTCLNGGVCEDSPIGFFCQCPTEFLGTRCEISTKIAPQLPIISQYNPKDCVKAGVNTTLRCMSNGSFTIIDLKWFKNDEAVNSTIISFNRNPVTKLYESIQDLSLSASEAINGNVYECQATNKDNSDPVKTAVHFHVCFGPTNEKNVTLIVKPASNNTTSAICVAEAQPYKSLQFTWKHNGNQLPLLSSQTNTGKVSSISVPNEQLGTEGTFSCMVKNAITGNSVSVSAKYPETTPMKKEETKTGMIVGIVIAVVVVAVVVVGIIYMSSQKNKHTRPDVKYQHSVPREEQNA